MTLERRASWFDELIRYVNAHQQVPFAYGAHDCALFVAGAIEAMTGRDLGADWRGAYADGKGARRELAERGFTDIAAVADHYLGARCPPVELRDGDVALIICNARRWRHALAICVGELAVFPAMAGAVFRAKIDAETGWHV